MPGSCSGIYCSHVLEHLAFDDFSVALENTFKYLRQGGVFRFVLPDLEQLIRDYMADNSAQRAVKFMEASGLGKKARVRGINGFVAGWLGNSAHLWLWDAKSMREQLQNCGFQEIRRAAFGDAEDKRFNEVEEIERFNGCLAMQCRK